MNTAATEIELGKKCTDCSREAVVRYTTRSIPYCVDCYLALGDECYTGQAWWLHAKA